MDRKVHLGSISSGTMRPEDLIPVFADELKRLCGDDLSGKCLAESSEALEFDPDASGYDLDEIHETLEYLTDELNAYAPDYCYFGAHPGDGADYGFWLLEDWQERAKEDGVLFVDDHSEIPANLPPERLVCVVNDHGNATLFATIMTPSGRHYTVIWSVV